LDQDVPGLEDLSRDELIALVLAQVDRIDDLIAGHEALTRKNEALVTANEGLEARVAKLEYLLSRNSGNSSMPPSMDDQPGKTAGSSFPCTHRGTSLARSVAWSGTPLPSASSITGPDSQAIPRPSCRPCGRLWTMP
jgi:hypothetical protein